eukprot:TRINITY_DN9148_c1_g1_i3.p1 TRINITY_DN9148_c1_g1~~TRINITY_DN9148_c1_g1_i3.p1  ORF type:complete len:220 (-),score=72.12 TRINITY_DN9148_c1_g1_i3:39-698(-)
MSESSNTLKIIYFAFPGRAECIRMLCEDNDVQYENEFVNAESFAELKKTEAPYTTVPILRDGDFLLGDSSTILRYIAENYASDALPKDAKDVASASSLCAAVEDLSNQFMNARSADEEGQKKFFGEKLPLWLSKFNDKIPEGKFVLGLDAPSFADYKFATTLVAMQTSYLPKAVGEEKAAEMLAEFIPNLKGYLGLLMGREKLAAYMASDRYIPNQKKE